MAAGYTLDHVMDEEVPEGQHLGAEACLATTLTFLAHAVLDQATATALPSAQRVSFMAEVHQMLLKSVAGQHRDLTFAAMPPNVEVTTDDALETTELKAGALGRLAGVIGARLASANPDIAERIGECCWYYATYRQLIDDLSCAPTDDDGRAGDASANKRTLPLVYWSDWQRRVGDSPTASLPPAL